MKYDQDKVDEMTLALLYLVSTKLKDGPGARAWKGFDGATLVRLYGKGWIEEPKTKSMSLLVTDEGYKKSEQLFMKHFGLKNDAISSE
jgi:hypothetical protein